MKKKDHSTLFYGNKGLAGIVLVVWIIVMLLALVGEFSYSMRTELKITRNFKQEAIAYQLALAGVERAKMELLQAQEMKYVYLNDDNVLILNEEDEEPVREGELGEGRFYYTITDEEGKLNINTASPAELRYIFLYAGADVEDIDTIVDSIQDWRDGNNLHRLNGAEEDYYRSLDPPYSSKDGPFSTVEELILVKGITKEVLFGRIDEDGERIPGVLEYLTVFSSGGININTAPEPVLEAVLGPVEATNIITQRESGPIQGGRGRLKVSSNTFSVISTGESADGSIKRTIKVIMRKYGDRIKILYWNDNYVL